MSIGLTAFTLFHVLVSLAGIVSGFAVVYGFLRARSSGLWTALFLTTTIATSVTGFLFPVHRFMPSHGVGIISLFVLSVAVFARYKRRLFGAWRWIYAVCAVGALYLNFFVLVVQSFLKVPALKALAPTQTEPPFKLTQIVVLLAFVVAGVFATIRFRPPPRTDRSA
jgi:hypothetical protein